MRSIPSLGCYIGMSSAASDLMPESIGYVLLQVSCTPFFPGAERCSVLFKIVSVQSGKPIIMCSIPSLRRFTDFFVCCQ